MNEHQFNILVTGGSGFIGTNLVGLLASEGHNVLNLDNKKPKDASLSDFWKEVDLLNVTDLDKAIREFRPDYVVHLAARTDLSGLSAKDYVVNTQGTVNVAKSLVRTEVRKVIFVSSMLVCKPGYIPKNSDDFAFTTAYGESKAETEKWIRAANLPYDWQIVRPSSIWGPWFEAPYRDFFDRVLRERMYKIGGGKAAVKTYGFVLNSVRQIREILFNSPVPRQVFYIGDEPALNINAWTDLVAVRAGLSSPPTVPYILLKAASIWGDICVNLGLPFPITSFRLNNMTTDNILPLVNTLEVSGKPLFSTQEGVDITLDWIKKNRN